VRILYDHQTFQLQRHGGVSRYFLELMRHLQGLDSSIMVELAIEYSDNEYIGKVDSFGHSINSMEQEYRNFALGTDFKGKRRLFALSRKYLGLYEFDQMNMDTSIHKLKTGDYDIFHPTNYNTYFLDFINDKPYVVTVFDMIHEIFPEYFAPNNPTSASKRRILERAARIIAISESTKRDLINMFGIDKDRIKVIYLGNSINPELSNELESSPSLPQRYILFVGNRSIYKNFYFFLYSIEALLLQDEDLYVLCSGSTFSHEEMDLFRNLKIDKRILHVDSNDQMLAYLYKHALAFVCPSLYEGFGIPVLESFACGCPAVISNTSSLREVGGDAAAYFDPKDCLSILGTVKKVIYSKELREGLVNRGFEQLKKFSWKSTAEKTFELYQEVLQR
jgi:glycosyltransferase involved in cell wall biosynthesis